LNESLAYPSGCLFATLPCWSSKTVLAPLLVWIGLRDLAPSFAERVAKPTGMLASVLLVLCVLPVLFASAQTMLSLVGNGTILSLATFAVTGFIVGHLLGGLEPENRRVLSLATATRHPGMAVAIAHANFPAQKLALPAIALYLIVATILSALVTDLWARWKKHLKSRSKGQLS
jgi:BASS family bile acid:Na+ symporter